MNLSRNVCSSQNLLGLFFIKVLCTFPLLLRVSPFKQVNRETRTKSGRATEETAMVDYFVENRAACIQTFGHKSIRIRTNEVDSVRVLSNMVRHCFCISICSKVALKWLRPALAPSKPTDNSVLSTQKAKLCSFCTLSKIHIPWH